MKAAVYTEVNTKGWFYKDPSKGGKGNMSIYIDESTSSKRSPKFQLGEKMRAPFGVRMTDYEGRSDGPRKNLELAVEDAALIKFMDSIDHQTIAHAAKHSKELFRKELTEEQLATLYRRTAQPDDTGRFAPLMRLKVTMPGQKQPTRIWRYTKNPLGSPEYVPGEVEDLKKGCHVTPVVELSSIWFASNMFGVTINATDLLVYPNPNAADEAAFPFTVSEGDAVDPALADAI